MARVLDETYERVNELAEAGYPFPSALGRGGHGAGHRRIRITADDCATTVPGLYAAGDAATRELICGGFTGGGSHNAAWAMSSGSWAGVGAARFARTVGKGVRQRALSVGRHLGVGVHIRCAETARKRSAPGRPWR
jgi:hypothetical protein